ncbi:hypothetical protein LJR186_001191 [Microbacterium foliorum]
MSDDYQSIPVAAARAAVQASGELEGIEGPLFLAESDTPEWEPFFSKVLNGKDAHPEFAQVIVTRKGQKPRRVVIAWDEYAEQMDNNPEWDAIRASKPMAVFGSEVERHAYRVVFADVLEKAFPRDVVEVQRIGQPEPDLYPEPPKREWKAEIATASPQKLDALYDEARADGALANVEGLQQAFTDRLLALSSVPKPTPPPAEPKRPRNRGGRGRR